MQRRNFVRIASLSIAGSALLPWDVKAAEGRPLRFGLLTDVHYADINTAGTRFYRDSVPKVADFVRACNMREADFIIETGDFKDQGSNEAKTLSYLRAIEGALREFHGPTYHVLGNHDMDAISKSQFLTNVTNTGIDPIARYYSFDVKGVHFVVLDANYKSDGADYDHGNFNWTDANISSEQLEWLSADLSSARGPTIVFCHQLLGGDETGRLEALIVKNAPAARAIFEASGKVVAVFTGHHHAGDYRQVNGIHYYTLKGMIEGPYPANNAFAMVEVTSGTITIDGYVNVADKNLAIQTFASLGTVAYGR